MTRRRVTWTPADDATLRACYRQRNQAVRKAMQMLGRSRSSVQTRAMRLGNTSPRQWSAQDAAYVTTHYPTTKAADIAAALGMPIHRVYCFANNKGLRKPLEVIARFARERMADPQHPGRQHQFQPGHVSTHKWTFHPNMLKTRFKPGDAPKNRMDVGTLRIGTDGYVEMKVRDGRWRLGDLVWMQLHRYVWITAHGPVPEGHVVKIVSDDQHDVRLENLRLLTRAEAMALNSVSNYPAPLRHAVQLRGALNRKINRILKEHAA